MSHRPNVKITDLTNVLLKPEPSRFTIQEGILVFVTLAIIAAVCLAVVWG